MSETEIPPGGWRFRQPQTNWEIPTPIAWTLDQATDILLKHRLANPAVVEQFKLSNNFNEIRREIVEFNARRLGIPPESVPKLLPAHRAEAVVDVAGHLGKTAVGLKIMRQWLGDGLKPIAREAAEKRAAICAKCPKNQYGNLWQRLDTLAAKQLKLLIEVKNDMDLKTSHDTELQTCVACDCYLPLKVHAPLSHIFGQTTAEIKSQLDPGCWIFKNSE